MKRVELIVGQGFDKHDNPLTGGEHKRDKAFTMAADTFGGYSVEFVQGGWIGPSGRLVTEPSMVIIIYTGEPDVVIDEYAEFLRDLFSQQSVLVGVVEAVRRFV